MQLSQQVLREVVISRSSLSHFSRSSTRETKPEAKKERDLTLRQLESSRVYLKRMSAHPDRPSRADAPSRRPPGSIEKEEGAVCLEARCLVRQPLPERRGWGPSRFRKMRNGTWVLSGTEVPPPFEPEC